jgi:hypothetical protein
LTVVCDANQEKMAVKPVTDVAKVGYYTGGDVCSTEAVASR